MKILGIIPARKGSKGVPKKNIKLLGQKPLLQYTVESCKNSKLLHNFLVSTDCLETISICKNLNVDTPFIRPNNISDDNSKSIDVIKHAIDFYEQKNIFYDAVCLLQPTSPFREKNLIDKSIKKFIKGGTDSLISVVFVPDKFNPDWILKEEDNKLQFLNNHDPISRRQDLPKYYIRDGSIYLSKVCSIKKHTLYGDSINYILNDSKNQINIDSQKDWEEAEEILRKNV